MHIGVCNQNNEDILSVLMIYILTGMAAIFKSPVSKAHVKHKRKQM